MKAGSPSRTAWSAARYRAAHQLLEGGSIFADALAVPMLGEAEADLLADAPRRGMRLFIAARHRFAEDALAAAVDRGVRQVVVLGAGLDTFAYRNPHPGLSVIEVDHPDTQEWKRERLAAAGIAVPGTVRHIGVDFEKESLAGRLPLDGPAFFLWLGVVPYLTAEGFAATLDVTAGHEVVFDYAQSPDRMVGERRAHLEARAERVARLGEPWLNYFEPGKIVADLRGRGFTRIEDLGPAALAARYFGRPDVPPETPGGHVLHAS
ncbi:methyltransferase (TIGR00027 family) [Actinoplanes campanulatus]|uniref:S-adenosyl-L-methionine-dependent methyltransferase n=1 Tax=Actinoplanes campanulatus TaxID=113559 RepID=A0A7W5AKD3_9ACTN|nr:SAM-dependent methyltransferase [Actinoplanes campanulatus]MBB3097349.1 methyltransferase (TIGR00027 family) [Actinoplanes campanulatus]GGN26373.1 S-adenosyl-L-methionine-dependent methyltransferase [Actinoplanes campanulatus]GID38189.1 S-adenosyl-L-methionine-dependent methyltransferase [Actinoplanes campanulatus]